MLTIYGIPNCDTIKKTRRWLEANGVEYAFHDYKKAGCPPALARRFLQALGSEQLINTRGTTWRNLPESVRNTVSPATAANLMSEHPSLIRRPIIDADGVWLAGFNEAELRGVLHRN
jgi:arsenate reductase